jgi:hypothetical protein
VAGCLGGAFNGIGAHTTTLAKPGNEKYSAEAQKVIITLIILTSVGDTNFQSTSSS